jgi:hypothetical protein
MTCISRRDHIISQEEIAAAAESLGIPPWMVKIHDGIPVMRPEKEIAAARKRWLDQNSVLKRRIESRG